MNYVKLFTALIIFLNIVNCSTMRVSGQALNLSAITTSKTYQVRVRSGNIMLDKIIHDYASVKFGEYLQITGKEPVNGHIEIIFIDASKKGVNTSMAGYAANMAYGNSWYTGDDAPWLNDYYPSSGTEITPGSIFSWQNSAMTVIIRDLSGNQLWKAYYTYKGGSDISGLYVKTSDKAARISLDRIIRQFEKDFIFVPGAAGYEAPNKMPGIALIVEDNASGTRETSDREDLSH